jgi:hypothetical protein
MNNCTQARGGQREEPQLLKLQLAKINLGQEQLVKKSRLVTSGQNYLSHKRLVNIIQATNNWSKLFRPVKSGQRLFKII